MALSRLIFNPGWGGLESIGSRWLSISQLEVNGTSSASHVNLCLLTESWHSSLSLSLQVWTGRPLTAQVWKVTSTIIPVQRSPLNTELMWVGKAVMKIALHMWDASRIWSCEVSLWGVSWMLDTYHSPFLLESLRQDSFKANGCLGELIRLLQQDCVKVKQMFVFFFSSRVDRLLPLLSY